MQLAHYLQAAYFVLEIQFLTQIQKIPPLIQTLNTANSYLVIDPLLHLSPSLNDLYRFNFELELPKLLYDNTYTSPNAHQSRSSLRYHWQEV